MIFILAFMASAAVTIALVALVFAVSTETECQRRIDDLETKMHAAERRMRQRQ